MSDIQQTFELCQKASIQIRSLGDKERAQLLLEIAKELDAAREDVLASNALDAAKMADDNPKKDRLILNHPRIDDLLQSLNDVANLPDPTGKITLEYTTPQGLEIKRKSVPLGVVGVIYESRPNVTIDVAALCLRSGNAAILRGGTDAEHTNAILVEVIHRALEKMKLPKEIVTLLPVDRKYVKDLLEAVKFVDIIIPRGSQELIDYVRTHAKVPTIETGAGVCHTYIESTAILPNAAKIVVNAKTQRPSVCNSLDTILVDRAVAEAFLPQIIPGFLPFEVEIFADEKSFEILEKSGYPFLQKALPEHFGTEFLSQKCSVKVVSGLNEALEHIAAFSSRHSEAIITENTELAERFMQAVDAAAVYVNASTRFTDGGVFGLGAEIGISTQKLHARGPFALEKLTTEKWFCKGNGQTR